MAISIRNKPIDSIDSLLFLSNEKENNTSIYIHKCDDRFIEYKYWFEGKYFIAIHDLFLNEKRAIETPFKNWEFLTIGDGFLLAYEHGENMMTMCLFKLDNENSTLNSLDSIDSNEFVRFILVDQLNSNKFMVCSDVDTFALGKIENEKIVLGQFKDYGDFYYFHTLNLMDNRFRGFDRENETIKLCEVDLNSGERKNVNVPIGLKNAKSLSVKDYEPHPCFWTKTRFYGMFQMSDNQRHLLVLNLETFKWLNVQVVANNSREMFIDSNEVLTLKVGDFRKGPYAYYRLNLRKPDTLKNLAHLTALRQSLLYGNKKYLECVKSIPIMFTSVCLRGTST